MGSSSKYAPGTSILTRHKGHAAQIVDERTLRCTDCTHTILLDANRQVVTEAAAPPPLAPSVDRGTCDRCGKPTTHHAGVAVPHANRQGDLCRPSTQPAAVLPAGGWRALVASLAPAGDQQELTT